MNILFLTLELPYPPNDGGRIRTFNILKQVSRRHAITLLTFREQSVQDDALAKLSQHCETVLAIPRPRQVRRTWALKLRDLSCRYPISLIKYRSSEMEAAIRHLASSGAFDVVHVDQIYLAQYIDVLISFPAVLTHHNVEAVVQRRGLWIRPDRFLPRWWAAWLEYRRWKRFELDISRRFSALVVVSQQDAEYFGTHISGVPIFTTPNGVDTEYFQPASRSIDQQGLVFVGRMDYAPNVDAMLWFCEAILPVVRSRWPQTTLAVVGRNPTPEVQRLASLPGIVVTGEVDDVRPYYNQAALCIVPLRFGGGTRLKVLEAMAMGVPVISTSLGCEGLQLDTGRDIIVADSAQELAAQTMRLLDDMSARTALIRQARRTVERRYEWSVVAQEQERAYEVAVRHHTANSHSVSC